MHYPLTLKAVDKLARGFTRDQKFKEKEFRRYYYRKFEVKNGKYGLRFVFVDFGEELMLFTGSDILKDIYMFHDEDANHIWNLEKGDPHFILCKRLIRGDDEHSDTAMEMLTEARDKSTQRLVTSLCQLIIEGHKSICHQPLDTRNVWKRILLTTLRRKS